MIYGSWKLPGNPENQNFKIEKNTWRYYHFTHLHYKWQSYHIWFLRYGARQTEFFCHSGTFFAKKSQKINILKKWKKTAEGIIILQLWAWQREFSVILDRFLTFYPPNNLKNQNFQKLKINSWTFYHFTLVYHKCQSYDVWFLRYPARQTGFFVILDHFLPFYPPNNPKNQNFWKMKKKTNKPWRYYRLTQVYQKSWSYATLFLRYGYFELFFSLLPP